MCRRALYGLSPFYVTIHGSQVVDSQSLAKAKKNDPEYKPISRTKYTY
jgi:hypothetical protein